MLAELHIENLAVLERVTLPLGPGLTAITGETGTGKSMVVRALGLVLGDRADAALVRVGAEECRVDLRVVDGDQETVLSRIVPLDGRSRAYIDGRPTTITALAEAAASALEVHGQHSHHSLLRSGAQRSTVDRFGAIDTTAWDAAVARVAELEAAIAALGGDTGERYREIDLLRYQIEEIAGASIQDAEEELRLADEEVLLSSADELREVAARAVLALDDDEQISEVVSELRRHDAFAAYSARADSMLAEMRELASDLRAALEDITADPERLVQVRARRQQLRQLVRKYGDDLLAVIRFADECRDRLQQLEGRDSSVAELESELSVARADLEIVSAALAEARRASASRLADAVSSSVRHLDLPDARLEIDCGGSAGERVEMLFSPSTRVPVLPLAKTVSGGELARCMLAIDTVTSSAGGFDAPDTVVYDEIDAGIGGRAAHTISAEFSRAADSRQVLVVTHLAQVASRARTQVVVERVSDPGDGPPVASVRVVSGEERVGEVARLLAGTDGPRAVEHAKELLDAASSTDMDSPAG
jgi:DNA repair protein RecN (Recombination protein N)